jgi:hypothetical protein
MNKALYLLPTLSVVPLTANQAPVDYMKLLIEKDITSLGEEITVEPTQTLQTSSDVVLPAPHDQRIPIKTQPFLELMPSTEAPLLDESDSDEEDDDFEMEDEEQKSSL